MIVKKASDITPLHDYVLVEPVEGEQKTESGIYIPESAKEKPTVGVVKAVGPGKAGKNRKKVKIDVSKGDRIYYKKWGGSEIKVKAEEWLLVEYKDVLAIIK